MIDEFRHVPTEKLLARVAQARANGDWKDASREWWSCIARARERVANVVGSRVGRDLVPAAREEDIIQDALIRGARRLVETLDDLSEGSFFAAMIEVAKKQCLDEGRKYAREKKVRSIDGMSGWGDDGSESGNAFDHATRKRAGLAFEIGEDQRDFERILDEAIPRLKDERARVILTSDREGGTTDAELAERLGISVPNLHKIRSRAMQELRGLIDS